MSRGRRGSTAVVLAALSAVLPAAALATALAGCGGAGRSSSSRDAVVRLTCNVAEASLFVDGRFLAPVGLLRGGVALSPGEHRLELRHDGYLPRFFELSLAVAEKRQLEAQLFPVLP